MVDPATIVPVRGVHSMQSTIVYERQAAWKLSCHNCCDFWLKLNDLRMTSDLCDVKIFLEDGAAIFNVHSLVLVCRSQAFHTYFTKVDKSFGVKCLAMQLSSQSMSLALDYMYGKFPSTTQNWDLLKGTQTLSIYR